MGDFNTDDINDLILKDLALEECKERIAELEEQLMFFLEDWGSAQSWGSARSWDMLMKIGALGVKHECYWVYPLLKI